MVHKRDLFHAINGGGTDCFSEQLFKLIMRADTFNRENIRKGFPEHVEMFDEWMNSDEKKFFKEENKKWPIHAL